jgi:hypothetical protein
MNIYQFYNSLSPREIESLVYCEKQSLIFTSRYTPKSMSENPHFFNCPFALLSKSTVFCKKSGFKFPLCKVYKLIDSQFSSARPFSSHSPLEAMITP